MNHNHLEPTAGEGFFLRELFCKLNEKQVRYAVLRNYATLPNSLDGSDLDLLVHPNDHDVFAAQLRATLGQCGGYCLACYEMGSFDKFALMGGGDQENWWGICLDVNLGMGFRGAYYADLDELFKFVQLQQSGFYAVRYGMAGLLGFIKELLNNSNSSQRYLAEAREFILSEENAASAVFCPYNPEAVQILKIALAEPHSDDEVRTLAKEFRSTLTRGNLQVRASAFFSLKSRMVFSKIMRIFKPPGHLIALHGVDGVGKSTVIDSIRPCLEFATHDRCQFHHLRPGLLPALAKLRGKSSSGEEVDLNPHRSAPSGFIGSLFRLIYLWCDYSIGYWVKLRLSLAKNPTVILFDRYAYDLAMDPARFRINLPVWLINAFVWLLPRPDLSICLYAPIDEVLKRKQELPREELERQTAFLRAYADRHSDAVLVSTDSSVDRVRDKVLSTISERLSCG